MAKPHKFAWTGVDIDTALPITTVAELADAAGRAAEEAGTVMLGKHKVVHVKSTGNAIFFSINDFLLSYQKHIQFHVSFRAEGDRLAVHSHIDRYLTTRPTVDFIPVGPRSMLGHSTYLYFVRDLGRRVRAADPTAVVTLREGVQPVGGVVPRPAPLAAAVPAAAAVIASAFAEPATAVAPTAAPPPAVRPALPLPPPPPPPPGWGRPPVAVVAEPAWRLELGDGAPVTVTGAAILGRDPAPRPSHPGAVLVPLVDPTMSVSKAHALVEVREGEAWVSDLGSTNGTVIDGPVQQDVGPEPIRVGSGAVLLLGDCAVRLIRAD